MLVMAIVIIVQAPRCAPKDTLHWVQESAMVEFYVKNPVEANGDGSPTPQGEFGNFAAGKESFMPCFEEYDMSWYLFSSGCYNTSHFPTDLVVMAQELGVTTVYLEDLISTYDFENLNGMYDNSNVMDVLKVRLTRLVYVV